MSFDQTAPTLTVSTTVATPVGPLALSERGGRLVGLGFGAARVPGGSSELLDDAALQLGAYFEGRRQRFDLPLAPPADGLLGSVLAALAKVPYGETVSYKELTLAAGIEISRVREVGAALGRNPLAIVLGCHRVIGSDGSLTGFGGGLERKRTLLELESPQLRL